MPAERNISVYQGDRWTELYVFERNTGTTENPVLEPIDFTGATPRAHIRYKETDVEPAAVFECTYEPDPTAGQIRVVLTSAESAKLTKNAIWDLETVQDGESTTWVRGNVTVTREVTRG